MRRFNQRQWEAIRLADRHVLVAAGAGTGKTSTVVGRILYLLGAEVNGERIGRPVRLREIGAITYTNAAAADLKRKLRGALREAGLRDAADEVDTARIGTIHAFCGDVLREFALRTGRDPFARVLEEGESAALADEATREAVLEALEGESVPHLRDLFATYSVAEVEGWVRALVGDSGRLRRILVSDSPHSELERGVLALAQRTLIRLEARLGEIGAFDFDRMIAWTRDLLADHPAVRRALQRRLHTLVVDEFQDVDPVQREIAYLLGEPDRDDPHTTRLMLVGDPKQSIYRFRRADVTVWTGVERDFREKGWGEVVALEENFRSVAPILALVDHAVGAVLDTPVDGRAFQDFEVRYAAVRPTRGPAGGDGTGAEPAVELLVVLPEDDGEKPKMEEVRAREAAAVARRAAELHDGGRGVRLGEMAVLLATWSDLEIYERALRRAGLRTYALRTEGFHERREVQDLVLALEAIRDPRDDRALFGFLRSPFVGVRDETLLALARAGSAPRWEHLERVECAERDLLRWAAAVLREQVALRDRVPTHELLERLLERTGYLAYLHLLGDAGLQAIANVRKLVRMARQLPEQGVGDFLRALKEARERKEKEGDARLHGERDDVLTITTIHSAKGLEWGVVFWCDLSRKPGGREGSILVGRDRIALRDPEAKTQSTQWIALSQAEEREGTAEQKRLWYVAATRAKDRLVLAGFCPGKMKSSSPGQALWERLGVGEVRDGSTVEYRGHDGRTWRALLRVAPPLADGEPAAVEPAEEAALAEPPAPVVAIAGRTRHSATELMLYARCPRRHWFRYVAGLREPEVPRTGDADGTGG
ncbi:MAG TPA: UvrD-helicase domain-containing protein, partial [Gemmatimonadales bacterium]|nr:UvrD-helicase domain-containing protein [Gemmatimonadales bacterium]